MKQCSKCGEKKPLTDFVIARDIKLGYKSYCKECHLKTEMKRYWENRDSKLLKMKEWRNKNKEEINRKKRERYATDEEYREHRKELSIKHGGKNRDKKLEYMKDYHKKNREHRLDYLHDYQDKNRKKINEDNRAYRKTEKGKKAMAKHDHKRRNLGSTELFPNIISDSEKPVSHHVDDMNYVWIPEDVHISFLFGNDSEAHREALFSIVVQLYPEFDGVEMYG